MKKLTLFIFILFCSVTLFAQRSGLSQVSVILENGNWIKMLPDARVTVSQFFGDFLLDLGLDQNYHFELIKQSTDKLGFTHYRYQEFFNGYPVEGGIYILHAKDGFVSNANGELIRGIPEGSQPSVSPDNGLTIAKGALNSEVFYWKMPGMEALIKRIKKDPKATFYPSAELVYAQAQFSGNGEKYQLAWKYELYGTKPEQKKTVFVDAQSGVILFSLEGIHNGEAEGIAETRYHGTQTIITDSISATEYRLRDTSRGGGIETYNMNENVDDYSLAVDFTDEDNYWDNANEEMDDAATDAHWGAEMFYDYFLDDHGRFSYDNNDGIMISYVHYDQNYFNAFSNGMFISFGDGVGNPLTSIDVVGHEYTHMVTGNSAGLIYQNQSGALNESFSDVFGTAVEFYGLGDEADWKIGTASFILRDMSNPNAYQQPDTYHGDYWSSGSQDQGGVHTNSGVQNFWFYLLSHGGSGVNDNDDTYSVDSLGMDMAAAIAYRNLTVYLTPGSDYLDARFGAIQAAEDLYGVCSDIALEVAEAWYAVGVGPATIKPDLQAIAVLEPNSSCDIGSEEQVSVSFRLNPYTGCDPIIEAGTQIEMSYHIDGQDPVVETLTLSETLIPGDTITYDFETPADFSVAGNYLLNSTANYSEDLITSNNKTIDHKVTRTLPFEGGDKLAFENSAAKDSLYKDMGAHATGGVSPLADNTGNYGYIMYAFGASFGDALSASSEEENFTASPDFVSSICICVDLTGWDEAFLNFDLRQTFSPIYLSVLGDDISQKIAARVTVDGVQIGDQFHPETNNLDPYLTHVLDMSTYAGTSFTLCFETVNFINSFEDGNYIGDKAMLDNIFFSQTDLTGVDDITEQIVDIYPNPTSGMINIVVEQNGMNDLRVVDLMGRTVHQNRFMSNGSPYVLDLSGLAKGIYVVSIQSGESNVVKRIVLE